jgi:spoIIIJ-associated protein
VQHYRIRRENELRKLARRAADQVEKTGRKQVLEPMPPNERRIVHMALRENAKVYTESTGEEPYRKVSVYPAEDQEQS